MAETPPRHGWTKDPKEPEPVSARGRHGFPRSHGPAEERIKGQRLTLPCGQAHQAMPARLPPAGKVGAPEAGLAARYAGVLRRELGHNRPAGAATQARTRAGADRSPVPWRVRAKEPKEPESRRNGGESDADTRPPGCGLVAVGTASNPHRWSGRSRSPRGGGRAARRAAPPGSQARCAGARGCWRGSARSAPRAAPDRDRPRTPSPDRPPRRAP
jgi:hypothetical protein